MQTGLATFEEVFADAMVNKWHHDRRAAAKWHKVSTQMISDWLHLEKPWRRPAQARYPAFAKYLGMTEREVQVLIEQEGVTFYDLANWIRRLQEDVDEHAREMQEVRRTLARVLAVLDEPQSSSTRSAQRDGRPRR